MVYALEDEAFESNTESGSRDIRLASHPDKILEFSVRGDYLSQWDRFVKEEHSKPIEVNSHDDFYVFTDACEYQIRFLNTYYDEAKKEIGEDSELCGILRVIRQYISDSIKVVRTKAKVAYNISMIIGKKLTKSEFDEVFY